MIEKPEFDVCVIGGGIVGLASAYKIQLKKPELKVLVLEKENHLAAHQSGNNSGVIHSGLYYKPGSFKAKNCVDGRKELVRFARENKIAHDVCGKIVVATDESELPLMNKIFENGIANDTEGIEKIGPDKIREIEPHCTGIAGIWVPCTGIIDFVAVTNKLSELITGINAESKVLVDHEVTGIDHGEVNTIHTVKGRFKVKHMVFFAEACRQTDSLKRMG